MRTIVQGSISGAVATLPPQPRPFRLVSIFGAFTLTATQSTPATVVVGFIGFSFSGSVTITVGGTGAGVFAYNFATVDPGGGGRFVDTSGFTSPEEFAIAFAAAVVEDGMGSSVALSDVTVTSPGTGATATLHTVEAEITPTQPTISAANSVGTDPSAADRTAIPYVRVVAGKVSIVAEVPLPATVVALNGSMGIEGTWMVGGVRMSELAGDAAHVLLTSALPVGFVVDSTMEVTVLSRVGASVVCAFTSVAVEVEDWGAN